MSFARPTIRDLIDQMAEDLAARMNIPKAQAQRSNLGVMAKVFAGGLHGLYGFLEYILNQCFPDTATGAFLRRHAAIWGVVPKEATKANGSRTITGSDASSVTAGALLTRADGVQFTVTTGATISGGSGVIQLEAVEPAAAGNTADGEELTFINPIAGVDSVTTTGAMAGGTDDEADEPLRGRLLEYIREPPHGGNLADYRKWAKETPGVTVDRVWSFSKWMGAGTVGVFFTTDAGIPGAGDVSAVQSHVDSDRQVTADVYVLAPAAHSVPVTISGLSPDTPEIRSAIDAELADLFKREAEVEDGEGSGVIPVSHFREAISIAAGENDHVLVSPSANVEPAKGELPVYGGTTWQ